MDFLTNGLVVVSGGEWPVEGSANWRWQSADLHGTLKIIPDSSTPESYSLFRPTGKYAKGTYVQIEHVGAGLREYYPQTRYEVVAYTDIPQTQTEDTIYASVEGHVVLSEYANKTYVLTLEVLDPGGRIKKIETQGDFIGMETMLTNVKKWINSPQIIVSEGRPPDLPFSTRMKVVFLDSHVEELNFLTSNIIDRRSEIFDDPWF